MKNRFYLFALLLCLVFPFVLTGCDFLSNNTKNNSTTPTIDNSDISVYTPSANDDQEYEEGKTYYTSSKLDLVTEVNGNYCTTRPFTLDENDSTKRIYHNIYFYVEDYFQIIYYQNVKKLGKIYAALSDSTDTEYAEVEYSNNKPLQINIIKQGVYNLVLDTTTFAIDMQKVGDISTPVYETIKSCELNVFVSAGNYNYYPMTLNTTTNEYYIQKSIPLDASIGFYSTSHISHYKMTAENNICDKLIYLNDVSPAQVQVHVGGTYNIYFNAKTYKLRLELLNADTATYYCQVGFNNNQELTPKHNDTPYLFEYTFVAESPIDNPAVKLPSFFPKLGMSYKLAIIDEDNLTRSGYVKTSGTYKLTVNLKDFTLTVQSATA